MSALPPPLEYRSGQDGASHHAHTCSANSAPGTAPHRTAHPGALHCAKVPLDTLSPAQPKPIHAPGWRPETTCHRPPGRSLLAFRRASAAAAQPHPPLRHLLVRKDLTLHRHTHTHTCCRGRLSGFHLHLHLHRMQGWMDGCTGSHSASTCNAVPPHMHTPLWLGGAPTPSPPAPCPALPRPAAMSPAGQQPGGGGVGQ
ncbi:hypothetical protein PLESTF_001091400 [Pleodorina starrii]|nr:hypothetical protein PLESTF_001091400 [Pleodorina starrii]